MESVFLGSFILGEEGEEWEGEDEGEEGASSGSDVCAGLAMLMLELDLEGIFEELERSRGFL